MDARYRVVLSGELLDGHELEQTAERLATLLKQPASKVRLIFLRRTPTPLNKVLDYPGAKEVARRLAGIGVGCRVEAVGAPAPAVFGVDEAKPAAPPAAPRATVTCPKCGTVQPASAECSACGIIFAKYHPSAPPAAVPTPAPAAPAAALNDADPDERMALFIGPNADRYFAKFAPFRGDGKYAFSWNWAAFFGGAAWSAYRGLWPWTALEVGLTLLAIRAPLLATVGHLAFTAAADFIYYRHVQARLDKLAAAPAEEVAALGGPRWAPAAGVAVVVIALSGWMAWRYMPTSYAHFDRVNLTLFADPQLSAISGTPVGKKTANAFQRLAKAVYEWHEKGGDLKNVSLDRVVAEEHLDRESLHDGWDMQLVVVPDSSGFVVISAGPDQLFNTRDDIPILFSTS